MNDHYKIRILPAVALFPPTAAMCRLTGTPWLWVLSLGMAVCLGCGSSGPERFDVSGTVTFNGQPIPAGQVFLTPDATKGNRGPQGNGKIVDGSFSTTSGEDQGAIGGPHRVQVIGFNGVPVKSPDYTVEEGTALFPAVDAPVDLPKGTATLALEVRVINGQPRLTAKVTSP
ncbi:MAG: hypothetical protein U9N87_07715 [Planctomycetota bacterium]|nr:hypothetical protein [Planctomycetota bacterium]